MATRTEVVTYDDIDGTKGAKSVGFALDGINYEIDLSGAHLEELQNALAPFIAAARRTGGKPKKGKKHDEADKIRIWAKANKIEVASHGRIPAHVRAEYDARNV